MFGRSPCTRTWSNFLSTFYFNVCLSVWSNSLCSLPWQQCSFAYIALGAICIKPDKMEPNFWSLLIPFLHLCNPHCCQTSYNTTTTIHVHTSSISEVNMGVFLHASMACNVWLLVSITSIIRSWYKHVACLLACWWELALMYQNSVLNYRTFFTKWYQSK